MSENQYANYFKKHYRSSFNQSDLEQYRRWFLAQLGLIQKWLKFRRGERILEIGSGMGGFYALIVGQLAGASYLGLELDLAAVKFANQYWQTECFKNRPLEKYHSSQLFNFVFGFEVLEHLENPLQALKKINQLLVKGGLFIGTTPYPYRKNIVDDQTHLSVLHPDNWRRLLEMAGFEIIELRPMSFLPLLWRLHPSLNWGIPRYLPWPGVVSTSLIVAKKIKV